MQKLLNSLLILSLTIVFCTCATTQISKEAQRIEVLTITPNRDFKVLGTITAKAYTLFKAYVSPEDANLALKEEAFKIYRYSVDAIIGVKYSEIRGLISGEIIGTLAIGTAIQYKN